MDEPLTAVLLDVGMEVGRATAKFGAFASGHEGYAVILEEMDELWDEIKANRGQGAAARQEAIQIAAMAVRYVIDVSSNADSATPS